MNFIFYLYCSEHELNRAVPLVLLRKRIIILSLSLNLKACDKLKMSDLFENSITRALPITSFQYIVFSFEFAVVRLIELYLRTVEDCQSLLR